jgi:hypothetical protein
MDTEKKISFCEKIKEFFVSTNCVSSCCITVDQSEHSEQIVEQCSAGRCICQQHHCHHNDNYKHNNHKDKKKDKRHRRKSKEISDDD